MADFVEAEKFIAPCQLWAHFLSICSEAQGRRSPSGEQGTDLSMIKAELASFGWKSKERLGETVDFVHRKGTFLMPKIRVRLALV